MVALIKTKVLKVSKFVDKYTIPDDFGNVIIKNNSAKDVTIWFDNEKSEDGFTLKSLKSLPEIKIQSNTIYFCVANGNGELNLLMWE